MRRSASSLLSSRASVAIVPLPLVSEVHSQAATSLARLEKAKIRDEILSDRHKYTPPLASKKSSKLLPGSQAAAAARAATEAAAAAAAALPLTNK